MTVLDHDHFSTHRDPIWRDRADFLVQAALPEAHRYEQLWCRQVTVDTFEVCCIPFFLYDLALGDIIETSPVSGRRYVMSRVVARSGRYVFRARFDASQLGNRDEVLAELTELGAWTEWSSHSMVAVDARDAAHAQAIADHLWEQERLGLLVYETGRTRTEA
jgi:hypothetical protein